MRQIFFIFLLFSGCIVDHAVPLQEDRIVNEYFDEGEIEDLDRILSFFDTEVQFITGETGSVPKSYLKFFKITEASVQTETLNPPYSRIRSDKINRLVSSLPKDLTDEIWGTYYSVNSSSGDSLIVFDIKPNGNYAGLLESSSKENQMIREYNDAFEQAGAFTPSMYVGMVLDHDQLQLHNERERLIVAVHYIALRYTAELRDDSNRTYR